MIAHMQPILAPNDHITYHHICKKYFPAAMAIPAPIKVLMKFTTSFVIHFSPSFSWTVAPNRLSTFVATKAATVEIPKADAESNNPIEYPYADRRNPPTTAAAVPSADIAPSVPGSTRSNDVMRNVVFPYALPISDANVSASLVASEVTNPNRYVSRLKPRKAGPWAAQAAHISPVAADPLKNSVKTENMS